MKIRQGFVSNSSSSSFVCFSCGDSYAGYDGHYDVTHHTCQDGHELCGYCIGSINKMAAKLADDLKKCYRGFGS